MASPTKSLQEKAQISLLESFLNERESEASSLPDFPEGREYYTLKKLCNISPDTDDEEYMKHKKRKAYRIYRQIRDEYNRTEHSFWSEKLKRSYAEVMGPSESDSVQSSSESEYESAQEDIMESSVSEFNVQLRGKIEFSVKTPIQLLQQVKASVQANIERTKHTILSPGTKFWAHTRYERDCSMHAQANVSKLDEFECENVQENKSSSNENDLDSSAGNSIEGNINEQGWTNVFTPSQLKVLENHAGWDDVYTPSDWEALIPDITDSSDEDDTERNGRESTNEDVVTPREGIAGPLSSTLLSLENFNAENSDGAEFSEDLISAAPDIIIADTNVMVREEICETTPVDATDCSMRKISSLEDSNYGSTHEDIMNISNIQEGSDNESAKNVEFSDDILASSPDLVCNPNGSLNIEDIGETGSTQLTDHSVSKVSSLEDSNYGSANENITNSSSNNISRLDNAYYETEATDNSASQVSSLMDSNYESAECIMNTSSFDISGLEDSNYESASEYVMNSSTHENQSLQDSKYESAQESIINNSSETSLLENSKYESSKDTTDLLGETISSSPSFADPDLHTVDEEIVQTTENVVKRTRESKDSSQENMERHESSSHCPSPAKRPKMQ